MKSLEVHIAERLDGGMVGGLKSLLGLEHFGKLTTLYFSVRAPESRGEVIPCRNGKKQN
jgi:hypothetical protein